MKERRGKVINVYDNTVQATYSPLTQEEFELLCELYGDNIPMDKFCEIKTSVINKDKEE